MNKKYTIILITIVFVFIVSCEKKNDIVIQQAGLTKTYNVIDARDNAHIEESNVDSTINKDENNDVCFDCASYSFLPLIAKLNEKYNGMSETDAENKALMTNRHEHGFYDFVDGNIDILFAYDSLNRGKESFLEYLKTYSIDDVNVIMLGKDGLVVFDDAYGRTYKCEYYYYKNMLEHDQFILKDVNGIIPNEENIINGTYPYLVNFYIIVKNNYKDNEKLNDVVSFLTGDEGKEFMKSLSYCVN